MFVSINHTKISLSSQFNTGMKKLELSKEIMQQREKDIYIYIYIYIYINKLPFTRILLNYTKKMRDTCNNPINKK